MAREKQIMGSWYHSGCWSGEYVVINTRSLCVWAYKWLCDMYRGTPNCHFPAQWKCVLKRGLYVALYCILALFLCRWCWIAERGQCRGPGGLSELRDDADLCPGTLLLNDAWTRSPTRPWTEAECCRPRDGSHLPCSHLLGIIHFLFSNANINALTEN